MQTESYARKKRKKKVSHSVAPSDLPDCSEYPTQSWAVFERHVWFQSSSAHLARFQCHEVDVNSTRSCSNSGMWSLGKKKEEHHQTIRLLNLCKFYGCFFVLGYRNENIFETMRLTSVRFNSLTHCGQSCFLSVSSLTYLVTGTFLQQHVAVFIEQEDTECPMEFYAVSINLVAVSFTRESKILVSFVNENAIFAI